MFNIFATLDSFASVTIINQPRSLRPFPLIFLNHFYSCPHVAND